MAYISGPSSRFVCVLTPVIADFFVFMCSLAQSANNCSLDIWVSMSFTLLVRIARSSAKAACGVRWSGRRPCLYPLGPTDSQRRRGSVYSRNNIGLSPSPWTVPR